MLKNESDLKEIEELVDPSKKPGQRAVMFALFYSTPWPTEAFLLLFPDFVFVLLHAFTMSRMMRPPYVDPQTNMIFDVNEPDFQGWCVVACSYVSCCCCNVKKVAIYNTLTSSFCFLRAFVGLPSNPCGFGCVSMHGGARRGLVWKWNRTGAVILFSPLNHSHSLHL
jgi:hypothetical protein